MSVDFNKIDMGFEVNPKGPMAKSFNKVVQTEIEKERQKLLQDKQITEVNKQLQTLVAIKKQNSLIIKQNETIINHLAKLTNGPQGEVYFMYFKNYTPNTEKIFIDFIRGDKNNYSKVPNNNDTIISYPYSKVFMLKITNDGPADIEFQTNRHAQMILLKAGEYETVNENENFEITEIHIENTSSTENANIRMILYA